MLGLLFAATALIAVTTACSEGAGTAAGATPSAAAPASPAASPSTDTGCPPDVNLMYEALKATPAVFDEIDKSVTGIGEPRCAEGWSTAMTVVKNADPLVVLFRYDPATGKWTPVAVGSDGVCDGAVKVPETVQAKLHQGC
ncbi:hypothetical protein QEZ54_27220 [Catellatospora sp. KI3]|uniref:hypothetical protein n=1 Tax=Catellatospora sp. KI3 TaxID=3041620 RepID=UPI002482C112|nr:hypothetical protein [Catellatospora sp. KI3]MDI1464667.1 hypothetical protein [Catellatospora sp. KI3]